MENIADTNHLFNGVKRLTITQEKIQNTEGKMLRIKAYAIYDGVYMTV